MPSRKVHNAEEELAKVRSLLQSGRKVFLRHDHSPGYLHDKAQWSGDYHLVHVEKSWDAKSNTFQVLWVRKGKAATATYTLHSHSQVLLPLDSKTYANMTVQIECDENGNTHTAKITDLLEGSSGMPGEVEVKWDQGFDDLVNVSQVAFGLRKRKRRAVIQSAPLPVPVGKKLKTKRKPRKKVKTEDVKKVSEPVDVIAIDLSSSDSDSDSCVDIRYKDPGNRKRPPSAMVEVNGHEASQDASSISSVEQTASGGKTARMLSNLKGHEPSKAKGMRKQPFAMETVAGQAAASPDLVRPNSSDHLVARMPGKRVEKNGGDCENQNGNSVGSKPNNIFVIPTATGRLFSDDDYRSYQVNYARREPSDDNVATASVGEDQGQGVASKEISQAENLPTTTSSLSLDKSESGAAPKTSVAGVQEKKDNVSTASVGEDQGQEMIVSQAANLPSASTAGSVSSEKSESGVAQETSVASVQENKENAATASVSEDQGQGMAVEEISTTANSLSKTTTNSLSPDKSKAGAAQKTSTANIQEKKSSSNSLSSYKSSDAEEDAMSTSGKDNLLTQEVAAGEGGMSVASSENSAATYSPSSSSDESESHNLKGATTTGSLCSEITNDSKMMAATLSRRERRMKMLRDNKDAASIPGSRDGVGRIRANAATASSQDGTSSSSSSDEDEEVAALPKRDGQCKTMTPQKKSAERSQNSDEEAAGLSEGTGRRKGPNSVTPQKSSAASTLPSNSTSSKRTSRIMLNGFCRSIPQLKDNPKNTIEVVQNMLERARECKGNSDEYRETLIDANMLLQETLYNLNEQTNFVTAPHKQIKPFMPKNDGNKGHIVRLAKNYGLSQQQIDELFHSLGEEDGYYSINKAIPIILSMSPDSNPSEDEAGDDNLNLNDTNDDKKRQLELLGSRVRTAFDDGTEHEGTVTTVHYRVTYDDKDTETFVSEVEAFENLACNDAILNGSTACDKVRCSMLEIFSGCSLLSTLCKRRGMNVMSIDNDLDSNATIKADFSSCYVQTILSSQIFDYIHMSPVCRTYSQLAGGKHRSPNNHNKTPDSHDADAMLMQLYFFLEKALKMNKDLTVTIENPRAYMRKGNIMKELFEKRLGLGIYHINYCQFGRGDKKPTNIWTNDVKLGQILEKIGNKCDCPIPHEESVKGSGHDRNFAALPMKLCEVISAYVHSKHTQLKFDRLS